MIPKAVTFADGTWTRWQHGSVTVFVDAAAADREALLAAALAPLSPGPGDAARVLEAIVGTMPLRRLPAFTMAVRTGRTVRIVARGPLRITVRGRDGEAHDVSAGRALGWIETSSIGPASLAVVHGGVVAGEVVGLGVLPGVDETLPVSPEAPAAPAGPPPTGATEVPGPAMLEAMARRRAAVDELLEPGAEVRSRLASDRPAQRAAPPASRRALRSRESARRPYVSLPLPQRAAAAEGAALDEAAGRGGTPSAAAPHGESFSVAAMLSGPHRASGDDAVVSGTDGAAVAADEPAAVAAAGADGTAPGGRDDASPTVVDERTGPDAHDEAGEPMADAHDEAAGTDAHDRDEAQADEPADAPATAAVGDDGAPASEASRDGGADTAVGTPDPSAPAAAAQGHDHSTASDGHGSDEPSAPEDGADELDVPSGAGGADAPEDEDARDDADARADAPHADSHENADAHDHGNAHDHDHDHEHEHDNAHANAHEHDDDHLESSAAPQVDDPEPGEPGDDVATASEPIGTGTAAGPSGGAPATDEHVIIDEDVWGDGVGEFVLTEPGGDEERRLVSLVDAIRHDAGPSGLERASNDDDGLYEMLYEGAAVDDTIVLDRSTREALQSNGTGPVADDDVDGATFVMPVSLAAVRASRREHGAHLSDDTVVGGRVHELRRREWQASSRDPRSTRSDDADTLMGGFVQRLRAEQAEPSAPGATPMHSPLVDPWPGEFAGQTQVARANGSAISPPPAPPMTQGRGATGEAVRLQPTEPTETVAAPVQTIAAPSDPGAVAPSRERFVLEFQTGGQVDAEGAAVVGRAPNLGPTRPEDPMPQYVRIVGSSDISRNHVRIEVTGGVVVVSDLHSRNGTDIVMPGRPPQRLRAGEPTAVMPGTVVDLGSGIAFTVRR